MLLNGHQLTNHELNVISFKKKGYTHHHPVDGVQNSKVFRYYLSVSATTGGKIITFLHPTKSKSAAPKETSYFLDSYFKALSVDATQQIVTMWLKTSNNIKGLLDGK